MDDAGIRRTIAALARKHDIVVCPHTATAVHELDKLRQAGNRDHCILAATAHPAKFDSVIEPLVGHAVPVPPALAELLARPSTAMPLPVDDGALREVLLAW